MLCSHRYDSNIFTWSSQATSMRLAFPQPLWLLKLHSQVAVARTLPQQIRGRVWGAQGCWRPVECVAITAGCESRGRKLTALGFRKLMKVRKLKKVVILFVFTWPFRIPNIVPTRSWLHIVLLKGPHLASPRENVWQLVAYTCLYQY